MQTTDQKVIEYLLGRIQELEQENKQLQNKIHNDFIKSITLSTKPIISEELIEKFKNEWNRTPPMVFKKKEKDFQIIETNLHPDYIELTSEERIEKGDFVEGDINFMELMIGQKVGNRKVWRLNHLIYRDLSKEEIIQKNDIVFNEDFQRYIEAYLLDGEKVGERKVKRKIVNQTFYYYYHQEGDSIITGDEMFVSEDALRLEGEAIDKTKIETYNNQKGIWKESNIKTDLNVKYDKRLVPFRRKIVQNN